MGWLVDFIFHLLHFLQTCFMVYWYIYREDVYWQFHNSLLSFPFLSFYTELTYLSVTIIIIIHWKKKKKKKLSLLASRNKNWFVLLKFIRSCIIQNSKDQKNTLRVLSTSSFISFLFCILSLWFIITLS